MSKIISIETAHPADIMPNLLLVRVTTDDGFVGHAPAGTFRPNPFGLHEVHGNVQEYTYWDNTGDELNHYTWTFERDATEWSRIVRQVQDEGLDGVDDYLWDITYTVDTWPWSYFASGDEGVDGTADASENATFTCGG